MGTMALGDSHRITPSPSGGQELRHSLGCEIRRRQTLFGKPSARVRHQPKLVDYRLRLVADSDQLVSKAHLRTEPVDRSNEHAPTWRP